MSCMDLSGNHRPLPRIDRGHDLTARQSYNRRNAFWLFSQEVGMYDPALGHARPHTTEEIADVFRIGVRTVQLGIASARRVRDRVEAIKSA